MDKTESVIDLLDSLYAMVTDAWGVPLGNDKCIIEREKAVEIINDIKIQLPEEFAEAKRLVQTRDELIGGARREAEAIRKTAEDQARTLVSQQEIVKISRQKSLEMIAAAEAKSKELRRKSMEYVDSMMKESEEKLQAALASMQGVHAAYAAAAPVIPEEKQEEPQANPQEHPEEQAASQPEHAREEPAREAPLESGFREIRLRK